ncbi:MAG: hypothetical protein IPJ20_08830 [Flammeovirgaceae bacterium]|nr:hypothetical protein [Flammeovirgaceae bacterium]
MMKLKTAYLKPKLRTFLGFFTLSIITLFMLKAIFHVFTTWKAVELNSFLWWFNLILFPLGISIGVTFGARRVQLIIADTADTEKLYDWTLEFLLKNELRIKKKQDSEATLESNNNFNRIFNNWFGVEVTSVKRIDNRIIVEGPFRLIDTVDSKLRYSKSLY